MLENAIPDSSGGGVEVFKEQRGGVRFRGLVAVCAFLALALTGSLASCSRSVSERALKSDFREKRSSLEELLELAREDSHLWRVSVDWYRSADGRNSRAASSRLPGARWQQYRELFSSLSLPYGVRISRDAVYFPREASGLSVSGTSKGWAWLEAPPSAGKRCSSLEGFEPTAMKGTCYIPLEESWYIYFEWT